MDYEFRILLAEKELSHFREMQSLLRAHVDVHDAGFVAATNRFNRIETTLAELAEMQKVTEQKLQSLIDIVAREHANGHKKP